MRSARRVQAHLKQREPLAGLWYCPGDRHQEYLSCSSQSSVSV